MKDNRDKIKSKSKKGKGKHIELNNLVYEKDAETYLHSNMFRKWVSHIKKYVRLDKLRLSETYLEIHSAFVFAVGFIAVFNIHLFQLCALLLIVSMDAFSVVMLNECPLTAMERKYLGHTGCDIREEFLKNMGIMYNCDHNYEKQIELLINVWMIIAAKILLILMMNTLQIKLRNVNGLYAE